MPFQVILRVKNPIPSLKYLEQSAGLLLRRLKLEKAHVNIVIVGEQTIAKLNHRYRKKNKPTDVLSFPIDAKATKPLPWVLGEIYICRAVAKRQALALGVRLVDQLVRLVAHGMVHLSGLDHERSLREFKLFRQKESKILTKILPASFPL